MRRSAIKVVVGMILVLVGGVWFFQGIGVIRGSFMTDNALWSFIGAPMVVVGVVLLRPAKRPRGEEPL